MKIITIVGARPQFIKAATISRIVNHSENIEEQIIHTGQHFDKNMSDVFFEQMEIPHPDYNLEINSLSHGAMTGRMLEEIEKILLKEKPDKVLVYGDTNSTLAGALAAQKIHIPVVHVEAGLRSFNMNMPEEINRILTDRISEFLFCPTDTAVKNLRNEGFENYPCKIINVGDVMYDAALFYEKKSDVESNIVSRLNLTPNDFILATIHRQENTDDINRLREIIEAFNIINEQKKIVLPIHPRTKKILVNNNIETSFTTIEPVSYFDIIQLLKNSCFVMTDSGGMQKEAFFFKKYCITLRNETEWVELLENQVNYLSYLGKEDIIERSNLLLNKAFQCENLLYGDGNAAKSIVVHLLTA